MGLGNTKVVLATTTTRVFDKTMGIYRKVIAGEPVPPELVDAYEQSGGETTPQGEKRPEGAVIAAETVVVHDDNLGIDRKVIGGLPVPPDLLDAYRAKTGDTEDDQDGDEKPPSDAYKGKKKPELEQLVTDRGIEVEGTGANGNVTVPDLVAALEHADKVDAAKAAYAETDDDALTAVAAERGLEVEGTGDDGAVTREDLVGALAADDVDNSEEA